MRHRPPSRRIDRRTAGSRRSIGGSDPARGARYIITVYRLLGLVRSYGAETVDAACARALELDVVDVMKVSRMLEQAREREPLPVPAAKVVGGPARFARDPEEFSSQPTLGLETGTP